MNSSEHSHSQDVETSGCVIVIDDNPDVRQLLACALEMAGFDVLKAGTELELQCVLTKIRPDALLIDLQRSPAEGVRLLQRIRRRQGLRDMPILFLASTDAEQVREQAVSAGADWFGERPVSMLELQNRAIELVRRRPGVTDRARRPKRVS